VELLLATYLASWAWLVAWSLALSPFHLLTRDSLLLGLALGLGLAAGAWIALGRPLPPPFGPALAAAKDALRSPPVLVLAVAVALGTVYAGALAFLTEVNEGDALGYHVARADFWMQEQGVGYVAGAVDARLDVNPPNAEIAQLATMLLSGSDRYVAIGQLTAYAALAVGVAGLARRIGLSVREALFAALAFSTLPVLALQASGGLNDLVLASFLTAAAYFALGKGRAILIPAGLAVGLGLGTKFTGLLALPTLALVAAVGSPMRRWSTLLLAGLAGLAAGSTWYVVNVVETGELDGGAADNSGQRADLGVTTLITAMRLALSFVDMSGAPWRISLLFLVGAGVLAGIGLSRLRGSRSRAIGLLGAAAITAGVVASPLVVDVGVRPIYKVGLLLGAPTEFLDELSWALNTKAEPTLAWYGPLAPILLVAASVTAFLAWRRKRLPALTIALAAAPWLLLATLALSITWDPWRGRFLVFGVALAAATWGILLRSTVFSTATAAIGATALLLALANQENKPSGLFTELSVWRSPSSQVQRGHLYGEDKVLRFVDKSVPEDAQIGVSLKGLHLIHPYFGPSIARHVSLLPGQGASVPAEADWLVLAPGAAPRGCPDSWKPELDTRGWSVDRRVGPDDCFGPEHLE
jgi:hypothetical protein